jgi:predicted DNA-binding transcriptional regulator AlpA
MITEPHQPKSALPLPFQRMLNRVQAAAYAGVGVTKFDQMVNDGRMPQPRKIDSRRVWDVRQIDNALDALPSDGDTSSQENNDWD